MQYRYKREGNENIFWKDRKKQTWSCMDRKQFMKVTKGKAPICADAGIRGKGSGDVLTDGNQEAVLYVPRQKPGFFQKITGYIRCTDEQEREWYVRILSRSAGKIGALILLLAAVIAGGAFLYFRMSEEGPDLDKAAISYEMPDSMVNEDPDTIALPGYSILSVSRSDGVVRAPLINPEGNTCYFVYSISLADTGEEIYRSGYIEPGSAVPEFRLNTVPETGSHNILVEVEAWDIEDYTQALNGGSIEAVLEVEE